MQRSEPNHKAIDEMGEIQRKYGGGDPEYITMFLAKRLNCLTKALIAFTVILAALTCVHICLVLT